MGKYLGPSPPGLKLLKADRSQHVFRTVIEPAGHVPQSHKDRVVQILAAPTQMAFLEQHPHVQQGGQFFIKR